MLLPQVLYLTILLNLFFISIATGGYTWHLRKEQTAAPLLSAGLLLSAFIVLCFLNIALLKNSNVMFFFVRLRFCGFEWMSALLFLFVLNYGESPFLRGRRWTLFIIPLVISAVVALDRREGGIFFKHWDFTYSHSIVVENRQFGPLGWVHFLYSDGLLVIALILLARHLKRRGVFYHEQSALLLIGLSASLALAILAVLFVPAFHSLPNLTPIAMIMAEITFAWAIFRQRILNAFPVAYITLWQEMKDAALVLDKNHIIREINPSAEKLFKRDRRALLGRSVEEIYPHGQLEPDTCCSGHASFNLGDRVYDLNLSSITTRNGLYGHLVTLRDITEHKLAEQRALELAVERERTHLLSSFIQDATHEFRTPLATIQSCLYLMEKIDDPARQLIYRQRIQDQADRIMALVNSLIHIARLDNMTQLVLKPANVNSLIEIVAERWETRMHEKGIDLKLELDRSLPLLPLAEEEFAAALDHLVDNALRYTPQGGCITLCTGQQDSKAFVDVVDTGEGIDPGSLLRIFQRLYRADAAHTQSGLGLGLSIARRIVDLHQGTIEVESALGQGSRFRILLPIPPR